MAEQGDDDYIKCARCRCKYHNNDESIKENFGFNRLHEQLKTCVKCRNRSKQYHQDHFEKTSARATSVLD